MLILAVLLMAAVAVTLIDWGFLKEPIESRASRLLGRQVTIAGEMDVELALYPRLIVRHIRVANADWSEQPYMLKVEQLAVAFNPLDWLTGALGIEAIRIGKPRLLLERTSHQRANWQLARGEEIASEPSASQQDSLPMDLGELTLADARIYLRDHVSDRRMTLGVDKLHLERQGEQLTLRAEGEIGKQPFQLQATGGTLEQLLAEESVYPIKAQLQSEQTELSVQGRVAEPLAFDGVRLDWTLEGKDLSRWSDLAGMELPAPPAFNLSGTLSVRDGIWCLSGLQSRLKVSSLSGNIVLNTNFFPPRLEGELHSNTLNVKELQAALPEDEQPKQFSLPPLRQVQVHLQYTAGQVILPQMPVNDLAATVLVEQGVLHLPDFGFDLGGGRVSAEAKLSEGPQTVQGQAEIKFRPPDLAPRRYASAG
jgi:uncharacterized protein involved in outer membrane biogenesis